MSMSDSIEELYEGRVMGIQDAEDASVEALGLMMAGSDSEERGGDE
jgi:ABC-type uncharacterized transport system ATPase subunit